MLEAIFGAMDSTTAKSDPKFWLPTHKPCILGATRKQHTTCLIRPSKFMGFIFKGGAHASHPFIAAVRAHGHFRARALAA
jgi:hypothetical protein